MFFSDLCLTNYSREGTARIILTKIYSDKFLEQWLSCFLWSYNEKVKARLKSMFMASHLSCPIIQICFPVFGLL